MEPPTTWPWGRWSSCIRDRLVTDLPQPDSPTTPTVLPMGTSKLTPSTALTTPASVKKWVWRSSNSTALRGSFMVVRYSLSGTFLRLRFFSYAVVMRRFSLEIRRDSRAER